MQRMEPAERMEIYIPKCAEVKSIPLLSLPSSVVNRMGLPMCDSNGTRTLQDSPRGVWICPVVVRKKGQKLVSHAGNGVKENVLSLLDRKSRGESGSCRMSFVSSNRLAYKLLKETMPGNAVTSSSSSLALGSSPLTNQDAVVIYRGQIYLSIRKPRRRHNSPSSSTSASGLPPKRPKELPNDNKPQEKITRCKMTLAENKSGAEQKAGDVSSSTSAGPVPPSTGGSQGTDVHRQKDGTRDESPEETAVQDGFQHLEEEAANHESDGCETQCLRVEEETENADVYGHAQIDSSEAGQSGAHSWIPRGPLGGATSGQNEFDFNELAQEEKIAQMKARLRQREAALENLKSS